LQKWLSATLNSNPSHPALPDDEQLAEAAQSFKYMCESTLSRYPDDKDEHSLMERQEELTGLVHEGQKVVDGLVERVENEQGMMEFDYEMAEINRLRAGD
jgi:hypothetical protein